MAETLLGSEAIGLVDVTSFSTLVQTIVFTLTLIVFIFQFCSQEKATKESAYQELVGRYNEYALSAEGLLLSELFPSGAKLSADQLVEIRRLMLAYSIIDEAYELYEKRWIDKEAWDQWDVWLRAIVRHPLFPTFTSSLQACLTKNSKTTSPKSSIQHRLNKKHNASGRNPWVC